jgi:hypothetical protein
MEKEMPTGQEIDIFKILIGIITALLGFIEFLVMTILKELKNANIELKKSDSELFSRVNEHERRLSTLEGEHNIFRTKR